MLVKPADLGIGNARLIFGFITANQLIGPPIGAVLFAASMASPFVTQAVLLGCSVVLVSRLGAALPPPRTDHETVRRQIAAGVRWMWAHPPVRTLAITIVAFNITFGAAWSVLVLYSSQRLGLGDAGFGLLSTMTAIGGVVGTWSYSWIERRVSLADIMRVGLIIETLTHLSLALTTSPAVAFVVFAVFGLHAAVWATTATSIRQRAVPSEYQGRVGSVYMIGLQGGLVVGAALGGVIAHQWGITAPFWFAFVGSAILVVVLWRSLAHIAHAVAA
jgi:predicted MFS family arabinose efflux permease